MAILMVIAMAPQLLSTNLSFQSIPCHAPYHFASPPRGGVLHPLVV